MICTKEILKCTEICGKRKADCAAYFKNAVTILVA
jgi:hypothetical protein